MAGGTVKTVLVWAGLALWCGAPVAGYAYLTQRSAALTTEEAAPASAFVQTAEATSRRDADLALTWHQARPMVAPDWSGVVQAVSLEPGQAVSSGDVVARVGGVDRLACASDYPMASGAASGDKGQDVATLQQCLKLFGHDVSKDKGSYGSATRKAVTEVAKRVGVADAQTVGAGEAFPADWLVFLPEEDYALQSVDLVLGAPAPPAGTSLAVSRPTLVSALLAPAGTVATGANWTDGAGDGALEDDPEGTEIPKSVEPDVILTAAEDETLVVAQTPIELTEERTAVSEVGLKALQAVAGAGEPAIAAVLERPVRADEVTVPAAAVVTSPLGGQCVLVVKGDGLTPVDVEVMGGGEGFAMVRGRLEVGQELRLSPPPKDRRCESN
jgi:hypothetical protein